MSQRTWTAVDDYISHVLVQPDDALDAALKASDAAGLPQINVTPAQGKMLYLLALMQDARAILEIGTLGGYSTIWMARALPPGGRLVTLEADAKHAQVAQANIDRAGLSDVVDVQHGLALDILPQLAAQGRGPFDLFFIDADKANNLHYFQWALKLSRRGSLIIVDNVVRNGAVIDAVGHDENVQGVRRMNEIIAAEQRVAATAIQTVGAKGYDGFAMALVIGDS